MKIKDGICGLIVGDALGVPVEFNSRRDMIKNPVTNMKGYGTYMQPPGTWSDDSSMTIATIDSIVKSKSINYYDMMERFSDWFYNGKYTQYGETFDYGATTAKGIENYLRGIDPVKCGGTGERDNGNGSLMRILPLAYIPSIDFETIENVSGLTHGHERSKIACAFYIEIAKSMIKNDLEIIEHVKIAGEKIKKQYNDSEELVHFKRIFDNDLDSVESYGYVIYTFESALHCLLTTDDFKSAVLKAVNLGEDTDTVGAVCGGLAGIYYGYDNIPVDWLSEIPKLDKVIQLCEKYEVVINEYL